MSANPNLTTYVTPIKFDVEVVAGAVIAGVILGLLNKAFPANRIVKLFIGGIMYIYGPTTAYGSFLKLAGLAIIADQVYAILKEHVVVQTSGS